MRAKIFQFPLKSNAIYEEGYRAYKAGKSLYSGPYEAGSTNSLTWLEGWHNGWTELWVLYK